MKIGKLTEPNKKGQVVIPKEIRDELGITQHTTLNLVVRGGGIYIYPVKEVLTKFEGENVYLKILEKTKGAWSSDDWEKTEKERKKIELAAAKKRRKEW